MLSRKGTGLREGVWVLPHCTAASLACWEPGFQSWAQSPCPELSAQGLVPLRWGCALSSANAPGKAPNHIHTSLRWGRAPGKPSLAGAFWAQTEDPSCCGAACPSQGRWDPDSLRPALSLGGRPQCGRPGFDPWVGTVLGTEPLPGALCSGTGSPALGLCSL